MGLSWQSHVRHLSSLRLAGSSRAWVVRQARDPYVANAAADGWRSRAAYKLLEIDDRHHLLRAHAVVVDLGAAPGSWTQVAVKRTSGGHYGAIPAISALAATSEKLSAQRPLGGVLEEPAPRRPRLHVLSASSDVTQLPAGYHALASGRQSSTASRVIAIDILPVEHVNGSRILRGDFTSATVRRTVADMLLASGGCADVVLSDMAHSFYGNASLDHVRQMTLSWTAGLFAFSHLRRGGSLLVKVRQVADRSYDRDMCWSSTAGVTISLAPVCPQVRYGEHLRPFVGALRRRFDAVAEVKPPSSRSESAEAFVVAKGFYGIAAVETSAAEHAATSHLGVEWQCAADSAAATAGP